MNNMNEVNIDYVYKTFEDLGMDIDEIEQEGFESGGEDWMDVISYITGKNAYDESTITEDDHTLIQEFISVMEENGIELW